MFTALSLLAHTRNCSILAWARLWFVHALGDLPVIGKAFENAPALELASHILYATAAFSQAELTSLNSLLADKKMQLPDDNSEGLQPGLFDSMTLRIDQGQPITVDLSAAGATYPSNSILSATPSANGLAKPSGHSGNLAAHRLVQYPEKTFWPTQCLPDWFQLQPA
ncbi:MAG: hypothetical protein R3E95_01445 [Thiolinea sp.]